MKKFWYPVALSKDLRPGVVKPLKLFGEPLVMLRDASGKPFCLQDRCPHRSTPLSLGRVTEGRLECRYHGWQFGQQGQCLRIPSQKAEVAIPARASATHRACVEKSGMIWVWADDPATADEAAMYQAAFAPLDDEGMHTYLYNSYTEFPHELAIENLLDPAHTPFTHHGTISRRDLAQPIRFEDLPDPAAVISAQSLFDPPKGSSVPPIERVVHRFYEPCVAVLDLFGRPQGKFQMRSYQVHFCVPVTPTSMHMFSFYGANFMRSFKWLLRPVFRRMATKTLQQDFGLLRAQKAAFDQGAPFIDQAVSADRLVIRYRRWLEANLVDSLWFKGFTDRGGSVTQSPCAAIDVAT